MGDAQAPRNQRDDGTGSNVGVLSITEEKKEGTHVEFEGIITEKSPEFSEKTKAISLQIQEADRKPTE